MKVLKNYDLSGKPYNRFLFVIVLLLGSFTMSMSQSSISTAYPTLMSSFGIDASTVQWLTTGFMLIMCVMMPVSPWLLNNVKFKQLFLLILAIFDIGTLIVVVAPNFPVMMLGRAMEAIAVGILFPSYQSVLLYITPEEKGDYHGIRWPNHGFSTCLWSNSFSNRSTFLSMAWIIHRLCRYHFSSICNFAIRH